MHVIMTDPNETQNQADDYSEELNQMWNVVYKLQAAIEPIMPPDPGTDRVCPKSDTDSCPSGHMLVPCPTASTGYFCKQCTESTFQPNENWITDKCRLRRSCTKPHMRYLDQGSTVRDAVCACLEGYHFPNEDQRACVPNKECPRGTAPGIYGTCEPCLPKFMYSDTVGRIKECKPLTNCEKQNRCTLVKSSGETDNVCGEIVRDLQTCEELHPSSSSSSSLFSTLTIAVMAGTALLVILLLLVLLVFFLRRRHLQGRLDGRRALSEQELDMLQQRVVKECDRCPDFCRKVLSTSYSFTEERIDRQIWGLAQELFRSSNKPGHFEQIVTKYKDTQARYTVNCYLQEWSTWRGENKETVAELFRCLLHVKREDIVHEICLCVRSHVEFSPHSQSADYPWHKPTLKEECTFVFFPCCSKSPPSSPSTPGGVVAENEAGEAGRKLLAIASDDLDSDDGSHPKSELSPVATAVSVATDAVPRPCSFCHTHPSPSAPELEPDFHRGTPAADSIRFSRQLSLPVQATS